MQKVTIYLFECLFIRMSRGSNVKTSLVFYLSDISIVNFLNISLLLICSMESLNNRINAVEFVVMM